MHNSSTEIPGAFGSALTTSWDDFPSLTSIGSPMKWWWWCKIGHFLAFSSLYSKFTVWAGAVSRRLLLSSSNRSSPVFAPLYPNSTFGFRLRMLIYSNRKRHCHSQIISPSIRLNLSSKKSFIFKKPSRDSALLWKCGILLAASFSSTAIRATIRRSLFSGYATSFGIPD